MEIEVQMFERREFLHFPFCDLHNREPEGQRIAVAFFCLHFLGEARKVSSRRSTTGRQSKIGDGI
jgi:hypothetical protein